LSRCYFSKANEQLVQNQLRYAVYKETGEIISEQDPMQLKIVMRSIFLQHGDFLPDNIKPIKEQIKELNQIVISWTSARVINELKGFKQYLNAQQEMYQTIPRSINLSNKGSRTLKSVTSTF